MEVMVTVLPVLLVISTLRVVRPPGLSRVPVVIFEQVSGVFVDVGVLGGVLV
jgi:hypothetical protein